MNIFYNKQGFTLLEVMISIAILAIGMLGIASLQMVSIEHNNAAYLRSQAITISQDIVERMRNNPEAVNARKFDDIDSSQIESIHSIVCLTDIAGCTTDQLADIDIDQWALSVNSINDDNTRLQLPNAKATIKVDGANTNLFTIKIEWQIKKWQSVSGATATFNRANAKTSYEFQIIIH
jgi:type IV pilus assembly protein PilV